MKNRGLMNTLAGMSHASPAWLAVATAAFVAGCGGGEGGNPQTPNEARLQVARSGDLVAYFKSGHGHHSAHRGGLEQRGQRGHPHRRATGGYGSGGR